MDTQTIEGNKLIAEFMGTKVKPDGYFINNYLYHSSWDWLMPVVEKIYRLGYDFTLEFDTCNGRKMYWAYFFDSKDEPITTAGKKSAIEQVYAAVIGFIQWYSTNNPLTH